MGAYPFGIRIPAENLICQESKGSCDILSGKHLEQCVDRAGTHAGMPINT